MYCPFNGHVFHNERIERPGISEGRARAAIAERIFQQHGGAPTAAPGEPGASGHVQVDVVLHDAKPGTRAQVTTSGKVYAPPPRIEQSLATAF